MFFRVIFGMLLLTVMGTATTLAEPYYARGSYYAGTGEIWGFDAGNQLFDEGVHGDGVAGDGVFGAFVIADQDVGPHGWKIATADWTENYPNNPVHPLANAILFQFNPGEVIHFRLDTNTLDEGWQPATHAVSCSHLQYVLRGQLHLRDD